jgi:hypothetical protein
MEKVQQLERAGRMGHIYKMASHTRECFGEVKMLTTDLAADATERVMRVIIPVCWAAALIATVTCFALFAHHVTHELARVDYGVREFAHNIKWRVDSHIDESEERMTALANDIGLMNEDAIAGRAQISEAITRIKGQTDERIDELSQRVDEIDMSHRVHEVIYKVIDVDPRWSEPVLHRYYVVHGCLGALARRFAADPTPMWTTIDLDVGGWLPSVRKYGRLVGVTNITAMSNMIKCSPWTTSGGYQYMICDERLLEYIERDILKAMRDRYVGYVRSDPTIPDSTKGYLRMHPCAALDEQKNEECIPGRSWLVPNHHEAGFDEQDYQRSVYGVRCLPRPYLIEFQVE